ncbi:MAG: hypothetical protein ACTSRK_15560 [Promethearchaeota archaeon]
MSISRIVTLESYPTGKPVHMQFSHGSKILEHKIKKIKILIITNYQEPRYTALFIKDGGFVYFPSETRFSAHSFESLKSQIEIEARTAKFSHYLGVLNRKRILEYVKSVNL